MCSSDLFLSHCGGGFRAVQPAGGQPGPDAVDQCVGAGIGGPLPVGHRPGCSELAGSLLGFAVPVVRTVLGVGSDLRRRSEERRLGRAWRSRWETSQ